MKKIIIMRGVPGSGKSTKAKRLAGETGVIFSTDDFFMREGQYVFDGKQIAKAHGWNQARAAVAMQQGISPIVVDNTNTVAWEAAPYVREATKNGYSVEFICADTPWAMDA